MFGRTRDEARHEDRRVTGHEEVAARGGVSPGASLTGVVVAFGAMFVLTAVISGILVGLGVEDELTPGQATDVGIATGIGLVVAQFLSYMWGGYAAGRMSRGAGSVNGALVALTALLVGVAIGAIATWVGATEGLRTPFNSSQLPADGEVLRWGAGLAIAAVAAMFFGGVVGGAFGSRWHTKLERRTVTEADDRDRHRVNEAVDTRRRNDAETIDLREDRTVTTRSSRE
ncbi:MAG TPA: TIGR04086 family membrane protein [Actinomycetota bacterium]|nr:TIGR04086 family membrane protein [Actinomycetota bacterium]